MQGSAQDVARAYLAWHEEKSRKHDTKPDAQEDAAGTGLVHGGMYEVRDMRLHGKSVSDGLVSVDMGGVLSVSGRVYSPDRRPPNVAVAIVRADGTPVYGVVSDMDDHILTLADEDGEYQFQLDFENLPLLPGRYNARAHAMDPEGLRLFDQVEQPFTVLGASREMGLCRLEHRWKEN